MIFQFEIVNFRSIRDRQILSFMAEKKKENVERLISFKKDKVLQTIALYGKNASGKTNVLKALQNLRKMIILSHKFDPASPIEFYDPFLFSDDKTLPTEFIITFEVNEKKYFYKISYNNKIILEESLFVYNSVKPSRIFERIGKEYFLSNDYESIRDLIERTHDNKLFLSVISQWVADKKEINDIYNFFKNDIIYFQNNYNNPSQGYRKKTTKLLTSDPNAGLFLKKIISYFNLEMNDIKADSFSIAIETIPPDLRNFLESIQQLSKNKPKDDITAETIQSTYEINDKNYILNFDEESNGTQKIYDLFPILYSGLNSKKIILLDEVEMGLHTLLAKQLIKLFQDLTINKFNSQLLFTTHDTNLLDLEFLRRDQIWFARKKLQDSYATKLYSLATIPIRLSTNIVKNYIEGKYTVPLKFKW